MLGGWRMIPMEEGPMKRRLRILLTFVSVLTMVMVLNVGAASAGGHEKGAWEDFDTVCIGKVSCTLAAPHWAPVGQNLINSDTGRDGLPGGPFDTEPESDGTNEDEVTPGWQGAAADNIGRNPNCPIFWGILPSDP
jgi:hypothetical protein